MLVLRVDKRLDACRLLAVTQVVNAMVELFQKVRWDLAVLADLQAPPYRERRLKIPIMRRVGISEKVVPCMSLASLADLSL